MIRLILTLAALALAGCSATQVAKGAAQAALGGGPSVAANVQAGQTNAQTIGTTRSAAPVLRDVTADQVRQSADENRVSADRVESVVVNEGLPIWALVLIALLVPSPVQWAARQGERFFRQRGWIA